MQAEAIPQENPGLLEQAGEYAETQLRLLKYRSTNAGAEVVSSLVARLAVVLLLAIFMLILNIGMALWIGYLLGHSFYGFFIVAGVYAIAAIVLNAYRQKWVKEPLGNLIVRKILK